MNLAQHIKSKPKTWRPITSKPYFKSNYSQYSLNDPYAANDFRAQMMNGGMLKHLDMMLKIRAEDDSKETRDMIASQC